MAQNIQYHCKGRKGGEGRTKARLKINRANSKACSSTSHVKGLGQLHPSCFANCSSFSPLDPPPPPPPVPSCPIWSSPCRHLIAPASPTSRGLQGNPGFTSTASHNCIREENSLATHLTSAALLTYLRQCFYKPFPCVFLMALKPEWTTLLRSPACLPACSA